MLLYSIYDNVMFKVLKKDVRGVKSGKGSKNKFLRRGGKDGMLTKTGSP